MMSFVPWIARPAPQDEDDAVLAARIARGDAAALELAYRREAGSVYRYALALCGNPAWASDAMQEAFVELVQHAAGFDAARGSLGAYLAGIARYRLLAQWREPRQGEGGCDPEADDALPGTDPSPESVLVQRQSTEAVWAAIRELPWVFREALVLVDLQERPYAEAAQIAGVELNTLRTRLHRARQRLARRLGAAPIGKTDHETDHETDRETDHDRPA
jgi:RNA polymerase sigma-70 factor (ECF subfamily)